jgi:predicted amino acid racemase
LCELLKNIMGLKMKPTDEYKVCSLEEAEEFAKRREMNYQKKLAEAPYHPGYEDAVVTEPRPVLYGIYKSKPLSDEEILQFQDKVPYTLGSDLIAFARAIEKAHGIK